MLALARALVRGLAVLAALLSLTATALALEQAAGPGLAVDAHAVEQRCEIFVSRLGLIETEHAADLLQRGPDDLDVTSPSAALRVLVAEDNPTNQI